MHWKDRLKIAREGIINLIKKYRVSKDPIDLYNLKRLLQLRRDIMYFELELKQGKTYHRSSDPYDQGYVQPNWKKIYGGESK